MESSTIDAGAFTGGLVPGLAAGQIAGPKGPAPALGGPNRVNHTLLGAVNLVYEDAVLREIVLDNAHPQAHALEVIALQLADGDFQGIRNKLHLRAGDPDISLCRPGAAPTATLTFKMQPSNIPRSFVFMTGHGFTQINTELKRDI